MRKKWNCPTAARTENPNPPASPMPGVARLLTNDPLPSASQRFVAQAYLDLLKRTADPAGLGYWSHLLDQGMATAEEVVADIEATPEYRAIEVQQVFGLLLNRAATSSELNGYGTFLANGGTGNADSFETCYCAPLFTRGLGVWRCCARLPG
jgi:hypothetical protein